MLKADFILKLSKVSGTLSRRELKFAEKVHDLNETLWRNAWLGTAGTAFANDYFSSGETERVKDMLAESGWVVEKEKKEDTPPFFLVRVPGFPLSRELSEAEIEELRTVNVYVRDALQKAQSQPPENNEQ